MRSLRAGIYVAIFISFLRRIARKACPPAARRFKLLGPGEKPGIYSIAIQVEWDGGLHSLSQCSYMKLTDLPDWISLRQATDIAETLCKPVHRLLFEANINYLLSGLTYRCTDIRFFVGISGTFSNYTPVPHPIGQAILMSDNEILETVSGLVEDASRLVE